MDQTNTDRLGQIFDMQAAVNADILQRRPHLQDIPAHDWIQKHAMALLCELGEMLSELNYKWWKNPQPVDEPALKEELVDILHFYISMCLNAGMTAQELFDIYRAKNEENFRRQHGQSQKGGYDPEQSPQPRP